MTTTSTAKQNNTLCVGGCHGVDNGYYCLPESDAVYFGRDLPVFYKKKLCFYFVGFYLPENKARRFFRNVGKILSEFTMSYPRRQSCVIQILTEYTCGRLLCSGTCCF